MKAKWRHLRDAVSLEEKTARALVRLNSNVASIAVRSAKRPVPEAEPQVVVEAPQGDFFSLPARSEAYRVLESDLQPSTLRPYAFGTRRLLIARPHVGPAFVGFPSSNSSRTLSQQPDSNPYRTVATLSSGFYLNILLLQL